MVLSERVLTRERKGGIVRYDSFKEVSRSECRGCGNRRSLLERVVDQNIIKRFGHHMEGIDEERKRSGTTWTGLWIT